MVRHDGIIFRYNTRSSYYTLKMSASRKKKERFLFFDPRVVVLVKELPSPPWINNQTSSGTSMPAASGGPTA